jgi:hypothetical protein
MLDRLAQENQIEIERSWRTGVRTLSAIGLFDLEEPIEYFMRIEQRFANRNRVEISRLILKAFAVRIGFNEAGNREVGNELRELIDGELKRGLAVTKV